MVHHVPVAQHEEARRERQSRREARYPHRLKVAVGEAAFAAVERAADEAGLSVSAVVRELIDDGLPRFRERQRSKRRRGTT